MGELRLSHYHFPNIKKRAIMWFSKNKIDKNMIQAIRPTSKSTLKMQCLMMSNGDIDKAERLYDYMAKGMDDLPLFDTPVPTTLQQVKTGAVETIQWLNENQNQIMNWVGIIKQIFGGNGGMPPIPPAPGNVIPPING
jgi:hypothetical protein